MPQTYSIFILLIGAFTTLNINSSTQSVYLPCWISWFFSSRRLCNKMLLSLLSTYKWFFFSLIQLAILFCFYHNLSVICLAKIQTLYGRNRTIDVNFTLRTLSDGCWLLGICIMIILSVAYNLSLVIISSIQKTVNTCNPSISGK